VKTLCFIILKKKESCGLLPILRITTETGRIGDESYVHCQTNTVLYSYVIKIDICPIGGDSKGR
jgi:hypothetical protein